MPMWRCARAVCASSFLLLLAACSNGRGSVEESAPAQGQTQFSVTANVTGLQGSGLVLQNNSADNTQVSASGTAVFATQLADGATYNVTVLTQPSNPSQTCTVSNGSGRISGSNIVVAIACTLAATDEDLFSIGGTVSGLIGSGLVLQNNLGDDLAIGTNGEFSFATPLPGGARYSISVRTQPASPAQTCSVANASGVIGDGDVTNIAVTCSAGSFALGGQVSGLLGSGLELQNGSVTLPISGNGPFVFPDGLATGTTYSVTVKTAPSNPRQSCSIANSSGTIGTNDVTNIAVTCSADRFTIGGRIFGLQGSGLVLETIGGDEYRATSNGPFQFPTAVASGTPYLVQVKTQPNSPSQECTVAKHTGVVQNQNITNIEVRCTTNRYTIGGGVSGLSGSGLVLRVNGRNDLAIASSGNFIFDTVLASGTTYEVTVASQPANPSQICSVANGTGTIGSNHISNVQVTCTTTQAQTFSVSGTVSGLLGTGLVLQNNGQDRVEVQTNGTFRFSTELATGSTYNVTVRTQPSNPTQSCEVTNGTGVISNADVVNVTVNCSTSSFSVGGTVTGLTGSGLVLRNNGSDDLVVNANGGFSFRTPLPVSATYNVTVAAQPTNPTQVCTVSNGSGVMGAANITNIAVSCSTTEFTVGGTVSGLLGSRLRLQNNGGQPLEIAANGPFRFPASVPAGSPYDVTIVNQPRDPDQTCTVSQGTGIVSGDVTNVSVVCSIASRTIGGTADGL